MRRTSLALLFALTLPSAAHAQGGAPGMYGVGEVILDYARFDDPKTSDRCGLSREMVASVLGKALAGTTVPVISVADTKPQMLGVARVELIPQISTYYTDDSLDCMSWISIQVQSKTSAAIKPVTAPRNVTILYWQTHDTIVTGQSLHAERVTDVLQKMAAQFAQQYRIDQPPSLGPTPGPAPGQ